MLISVCIYIGMYMNRFSFVIKIFLFYFKKQDHMYIFTRESEKDCLFIGL